MADDSMTAPTKDGFEGFMEPFQEPLYPPRPADVAEALTPVEGLPLYVWRLKPVDLDDPKEPVGVEMILGGERISILEPSLDSRPRLKKSQVRAIMANVANTSPLAQAAIEAHMSALEAKVVELAERNAELEAATILPPPGIVLVPFENLRGAMREWGDMADAITSPHVHTPDDNLNALSEILLAHDQEQANGE